MPNGSAAPRGFTERPLGRPSSRAFAVAVAAPGTTSPSSCATQALGRRKQVPMDGQQVAESPETGEYRESVLAEISREIVRLYKEQFGRGPTRARTAFAGPDLVVCTLEETFTPAERRLAEMGQHQRLRETRLYFQYAIEGEFREVIERLLQRRVRAFNSSIDTKVDVCVEIFHLERPEQDGPG